MCMIAVERSFPGSAGSVLGSVWIYTWSMYVAKLLNWNEVGCAAASTLTASRLCATLSRWDNLIMSTIFFYFRNSVLFPAQNIKHYPLLQHQPGSYIIDRERRQIKEEIENCETGYKNLMKLMSEVHSIWNVETKDLKE